MARLPVALAPTRASTSCLLSTTTTTTTHTTITPASLRAHARHATFIARPRRPYKFTQMVRLTDGSTYTMRTTSPEPLYRPAKDTRNALLWQPTDRSLRNVELDEAGRLAAFRERFGRGFDAASAAGEEEGAAAAAAEAEAAPASKTEGASGTGDAFADLLAGYAPKDTGAMKESGWKKSLPGKRK